MEPIAIIGMACRFPGAPSVPAFWRMLCEGGNGIDLIPPDRWDGAAFFDEDPKTPGKTNSRYGGFIANIDGFDANFFGISPREAVQMDPQQRILLELTYEALEDAGLPPSSLRGSDTAVYIGVISNDYQRHQAGDNYRKIDVHSGGGAGFSMLANRLSYQFDLHGPSMAIDSACSSSLVSVYQGCQALWTGESELAIAGGVNLILDPGYHIFYAKGGLLAPDGLCKTFAKNANGIGRSEGAGLVILKRQGEALRDNDAIYGVIRGGAVNHDGRSNGVTSPNRWAQEKVVRKAWQQAGITGNQLDYIELHGTGTYIGDPIEANALGAALKKDGYRHKCLVGSVKSNLGHLEAAAGIAGLIKLALCLSHRSLVPSLWFDAPNPVIDFTELPLAVNTRHRPWPEKDAADQPLLAAISSFGLGGTNAHLVMQSAPLAVQPEVTGQIVAPLLLVLSGHTEAALHERAGQYNELLGQDVDAAAVARAAMARDLHAYRLNILARDRAGLRRELDRFLRDKPSMQVISGCCKSPKQKVQVALPQALSLAPRQVAQWLRQAPAGRKAWQDWREVLLCRGVECLPSLERLADAVVSENEATRAIWCFAAQYAMLKQILAALPTPPTLVPEGELTRLAACSASGELSLGDAFNRLQQDLSATAWPALGATPYHTAHKQWLNQLKAQSEKNRITLVVNIDAASLPLNALHCLGQYEDDYNTLFARLNLLCQVRLSALADRGVIRLPSYPWQRKSYWLPRPPSLDPPSTAGKDPAGLSFTPNITPVQGLHGSLRHRLTGRPVGEQKILLLTYLRESVGDALHLATDDIHPEMPINTMGIDSLTAVEIKNRIERDVQVNIPVVKFLDGFTVVDLLEFILDQLNGKAGSPPPTASSVPVTMEVSDVPYAGQVATMSMDQVNQMLLEFGTTTQYR